MALIRADEIWDIMCCSSRSTGWGVRNMPMPGGQEAAGQEKIVERASEEVVWGVN